MAAADTEGGRRFHCWSTPTQHGHGVSVLHAGGEENDGRQRADGQQRALVKEGNSLGEMF